MTAGASSSQIIERGFDAGRRTTSFSVGTCFNDQFAGLLASALLVDERIHVLVRITVAAASSANNPLAVNERSIAKWRN